MPSNAALGVPMATVDFASQSGRVDPGQAGTSDSPTARRWTYRGNYGGAQSIRISKMQVIHARLVLRRASGLTILARCANPNGSSFSHILFM